MTLQHISERRPKKIDLNLLPAEYRPPKKSYLGPALYIVVFILICAMSLLLVMKSGVDSDVKSRNQTLTNLQQQLIALQANKAEADPLTEQIAAVQDQLASMETDYQSFLDNRIMWSQILDEVDGLVPGNRITLASISTSADEVTIQGTATKRIYVYDYAVELEDSEFFDAIDFSFGDCPETDNCDFTITAPLTQHSGETDE